MHWPVGLNLKSFLFEHYAFDVAIALPSYLYTSSMQMKFYYFFFLLITWCQLISWCQNGSGKSYLAANSHSDGSDRLEMFPNSLKKVWIWALLEDKGTFTL